ncbi:MAG TPA: hypothetical protein VIA45_13605 [Thermoanaerobaculia bacterium]
MASSEIEEAGEVAHRSASSALKGQSRLLFEALDIDGILERHLGRDVWRGLTDRQREPLRAVVRQTFLAALTPPATADAEVAWSSARPEADGVAVFLGVRFGDRSLKTGWTETRAAGGGWRIEDVVLSDPGISLARRAVEALGPRPVTPRDRNTQARRVVLPRLVGLAVIALVVLLLRLRLRTRRERLILHLTAAAPALLFTIDGALAVQRVLAEPYVVAEAFPPAPWERWTRLALETEREGRLAEADALWRRAAAAGAPEGPARYERGLAARERGDGAEATRDFLAALSAAPPAPGAARELAVDALTSGKNADALALLERYTAATGPDPDTLGLVAVVETNLGEARKALDALRQARELVGGGARGAELEARVRARAADGPGAVAALREVPSGLLDREALRADPSFLPIATDPAWVAFLDEAPAAAGSTPTPAPR